MNTSCHSTIAARIETAAAAIILFLTTLTSCGRSSSPEPLDQWNDGTSTLHTADPVIAEGRKLFNDKEYQNFRLTGEALTQPGSEAGLLFHTDGESGYEVIFRNGDIDGTRKSGSLASVRNLYRSLAKDGEWFDFEITVRGQNIIVCINGTEVVCYTEPGHPYRTEEHARQLLSQGSIALQGIHGEVSFRNLAIERLAKEARNEADTLAPVDERTDEIIRLQQHDFPVIDYHVHLKGGLTKEMAHAMSMNYGINYGVAPNAGEGGVGRMLAVVGVVSLLAIYFFMKGYKNGMAVRTLKLLQYIPFIKGWAKRFSENKRETLERVDSQIAELHKQRKSTFYASLSLEFMARILGCLEVYFILNILTTDVSFPACILIMAFTSLFANLFFFSPMQLGAREGGFALAVGGLAIPGAFGVYTGLITRVRELIWIVIGVLLMKVGNGTPTNKA